MEPQSELLQPDDELFTELFSVLNDDDRKKKSIHEIVEITTSSCIIFIS